MRFRTFPRFRSQSSPWASTWRASPTEWGSEPPVFGQFLFVGRLAEKKGVDVLLRALADVPEATLVVGGDGPDDSALRALSQDLGIGGRVRFVAGSPAISFDASCGAPMRSVPSLVARDGDQDTTPLVMSESMSAAVPVIASRLGGLAERIEPGVTGLLAEPGSPKALAEALRDAVADAETLERCGRNAQARIRGSALDLRTTVAAYTQISAKCLSGPLRKSPIA